MPKPPNMTDEGWKIIDGMILQLSEGDQQALVEQAQEDEPQGTDMNQFLFGRGEEQDESDDESEDHGD